MDQQNKPSQSNVFQKNRLSKKGIVLFSLIHFLQVLKAIWPLYILALFKKSSKIELLVGILIVVFLFLVVNAILEFINFSYFVDEKTGELIINKGLINKKTTKIEVEKIQEVNIQQPFIHRILDLYKLEVDSPGGDKKEMQIHAISHENAMALKEYLLGHRVENKSVVSENNPSQKTIIISNASLLKYGFTANYVSGFFAIFGFIFYIYDKLKDFFDQKEIDDFVLGYQKQLSKHWEEVVYTLGFLSMALGLFLLVVLIRAVMIFIKFYQFEIVKTPRHWTMKYGLFHTKNTTVGLSKVQMITASQNFFQRKLDVWQLKIQQIETDEVKENAEVIPGCNQREKEEIVYDIWGDLGDFLMTIKPNIRKIILTNVLFILVPIIISIFALSIFEKYTIGVLIYALLMEVVILISFRNNKLQINNQFVKVDSGFWDVKTKIIDLEKVQSIRLTQFFWQKESDLGTITLNTSGGNLKLKTTSFSSLKKIANFCLFKIENSKKNWF